MAPSTGASPVPGTVIEMISREQARAVLGVGEHADADEVRRAYRRLARHAHPDAGGDAAAFHRLQQALDTLVDAPSPAPPASSPSTTSMTRPSTPTRMGGTGWGESAGPRWHEGRVETDGIDWDVELPRAPHPWTRDLVAVAALAEAGATVVRPVAGVSRRPGSRLNRWAGWLSSDLLARWWVRPAQARGVAGHDVELRLELEGTRARRLADDATWPLGWTRERRPSTTVVSSVLTPSPDPHATALRAADQLVQGLDALGWPVSDWYRVGDH